MEREELNKILELLVHKRFDIYYARTRAGQYYITEVEIV